MKFKLASSVCPAANESNETFGIIGRNAVIVELLHKIKKIGPSSLRVLITGESGVGKDLVARALHACSPRSKSQFVTMNCGGLHEQLADSQLFGHKKGAFTGATETKEGLLEIASGGTIFFDEIGEMPLPVQAKLLRTLQNGEFTRLGENTLRKFDGRVIAATNVDLDQAIQNGRFRLDLFYRLNGEIFHIPPLRERSEDIPLLVDRFLKMFGKDKGQILTIDDEAIEMLIHYHFPGNIRELENAIERAAALADDGVIRIEHLPKEIVKGSKHTPRYSSKGVRYDALLDVLKNIRLSNTVKPWYKTLKVTTAEEIADFLARKGEKEFSRKEFSAYLGRDCGYDPHKHYAGAGSHLKVLTDEGILVRNGKATSTRFRLSAEYLSNG